MQVNIEINCDSERWNKFVLKADNIFNESANLILQKLNLVERLQYVEISVLLTDDESMRILNNDYRGKDKATNVLSFPSEILIAGDYSEIDENIMLGDLAFAYEIIKKEADEKEIPIEKHFTHLVVHGILHLLGYDHVEDEGANEMESFEIEVLEKMGVSNPY